MSSRTPANGVTVTAAPQTLILQFSEVIQIGTGTIDMKKSDGHSVQFVRVTTAASCSVSPGASTTLTCTLTATKYLPDDYYVLIPNGAVLDVAGNAYAGIASTTGYTSTVCKSIYVIAMLLSLLWNCLCPSSAPLVYAYAFVHLIKSFMICHFG